MRDTLLAFKPHFYIKGGDHSGSSLISKDVLAEWGGKTRFTPLVEGKSTTQIIEKTSQSDEKENIPVDLPLSRSSEKGKAVFLDRDGVINEERECVSEESDFIFLPHVFEDLAKMQKSGYHIVIVTTQAGIGLGYFTKEDFYKVNKKMLRRFNNNDITISKIYFCPHSVADNCDCRKPTIGLLKRARVDLNLDLSQCWVIGDKTSDIEAGKRAGCRTILVETGHEGKDTGYDVIADFRLKNLEETADIIRIHP